MDRMPFVFSHTYFFGTDLPAVTLPYAIPGTAITTVTDDQDGTDDGVIANGASFSWSNSFGNFGVGEFLGLTANGDPFVILELNGIDYYYVLSDDPSLSGPLGARDTTSAMCFLAGTGIETDTGVVPVQDLRIGDPVRTADGRAVPVMWIGRQKVSTRFDVAARLRPVRIRAGALGPNRPRRDLCLTPDHAVLIDGMLVNAGALVNGGSVSHMPMSAFDDGYTVYHIETAAHDIILAEGCPAETYIDYAARQRFHNYAEYAALYGSDRMIAEASLPRISTARHLPGPLKARLGLAHAA